MAPRHRFTAATWRGRAGSGPRLPGRSFESGRVGSGVGRHHEGRAIDRRLDDWQRRQRRRERRRHAAGSAGTARLLVNGCGSSLRLHRCALRALPGRMGVGAMRRLPAGMLVHDALEQPRLLPMRGAAPLHGRGGDALCRQRQHEQPDDQQSQRPLHATSVVQRPHQSSATPERPPAARPPAASFPVCMMACAAAGPTRPARRSPFTPKESRPWMHAGSTLPPADACSP